MKKVFFAGTKEISHFSIECDCGEVIFSHQFEMECDVAGNVIKGSFVCPHCVKDYALAIRDKTFTLCCKNVFDN